MKYSEKEMADAIQELIDIIISKIRTHEFYQLCEKHEVIHEIYQFGPDGPAGIGLGNFGGHAVG